MGIDTNTPTQTPEVKLVDVNARNWNGHEEQINQIFSLYREKVNPLVAVFNVLENSFPIGVMNELRDVFSHMTLSMQAKEHEDIDRHLDKAKRHMKRAAIDAFKYACMAYSKVYDDFRDSYQHVDLGYVHDGQFLPKIVRLNAEAEKLMAEAKTIESDIHDDEDMYAAYEKAFNRYSQLYESLMDAMGAVETLRIRTVEDIAAKEKRQRTDRRINVGGLVFGIIGFLVGVAGIVIGYCI